MTPYEDELSQIAQTVEMASAADITGLKAAIVGASEASIIAIGSGGSYTVASLLCSLHEAYTGRVSRAITPLELICNPTLAVTSPIFIISAEGKNPDILEALQRARENSSRAVHVITNRADSELSSRIRDQNDVSLHVFELEKKDGYLATNSLIFDSALIARAYGELDRGGAKETFKVSDIMMDGLPLSEWLATSEEFASAAAQRGNLIVVFSPNLRPVAEDLESRFSEAALLFTQLADFRSFAHGRHLWLTERSSDVALLGLIEPDVRQLWENMHPQVPPEVPKFCIPLEGARPRDLLTGLIAEMHLVSEIANAAGKNIAKPKVSEFGRELYYADLASLIPPPLDDAIRGEHAKYEVLGAHWPSPRKSGRIRRALETVEQEFTSRTFRAIVFDYDGTLCSSNALDLPPPTSIIEQLTRLAQAGIVIGIASGRGGSVADHLRDRIAHCYWPRFRLGLYNSGWIGRIGETLDAPADLSEFLIHARRIIWELQSYGVPISTVKANAPYQLSVRFNNGVSTESMWFVIADAFRQAGLETSTIVRSKHSVDVLSRGVSKSHLVAQIVKDEKIDPYAVLTMGDLGAWPGNDSSLLRHRFSLSVDLPSRQLDRGWKLAPRHKREVDATIWYLERLSIQSDGTFTLALASEPT